jgi:hypothetical protein
MRKVKSRKVAAKVTRPARPSSPTGRQKAAGRAKSKPERVKKGRSVGGVKRRATIGVKAANVAKAARPELQIRELDPLRVCGGRTSVVQLFRVDEQLLEGKAAGARQVHLVFNDRHGWYCEHGRSCHAVTAVMRHAGIR